MGDSEDRLRLPAWAASIATAGVNLVIDLLNSVPWRPAAVGFLATVPTVWGAAEAVARRGRARGRERALAEVASLVPDEVGDGG